MCATGLFLAVSHALPQFQGPALHNFGVPSIYVYTIRHRTIEFGVVTHGEGRVLGFSHAIAFAQCVARFFSDS